MSEAAGAVAEGGTRGPEGAGGYPGLPAASRRQGLVAAVPKGRNRTLRARALGLGWLPRAPSAALGRLSSRPAEFVLAPCGVRTPQGIGVPFPCFEMVDTKRLHF